MTRSFKVQTGAKTSVTNITDLVRKNLQGVREALVHVSIPHTTAALFLAEDDAELREDYIRIATETFASLRPFKHIRKNNPNTEAHAFSSLFGACLTIAVACIRSSAQGERQVCKCRSALTFLIISFQ